MKKFISVLLIICMLFSVGVILTSCDDHEHTWDAGVITTQAAAEADGVKTFTCTECNKTKTEPVKYEPKTTITQAEFEELILQVVRDYKSVTIVPYDDMSTPDKTKTVVKFGLYEDIKVAIVDTYIDVDGEWVWDNTESLITVEISETNRGNVYRATKNERDYTNCTIKETGRTPDSYLDGVTVLIDLNLLAQNYNEDEKAYIFDNYKIYIADSTIKYVANDDTIEVFDIGTTQLEFPQGFNTDFIANPPTNA